MAIDMGGVAAELWFVGGLPREDTLEAVLRGPRGSFLIRERDAQPGFVICVNDGNGAVLQYQVKLTDVGTLLFTEREFETLHDVVGSLRATPPVASDNLPLDFAAPATRGWLHVTTWKELPPAVREMYPPAGAVRTVFTRYVGSRPCAPGTKHQVCVAHAVADLTGGGLDTTPLPAVLLSVMAEEVVVRRREDVLERIPKYAVQYCAIGPPALDDCFGIIHDTIHGQTCTVFRSRSSLMAAAQIQQLAKTFGTSPKTAAPAAPAAPSTVWYTDPKRVVTPPPSTQSSAQGTPTRPVAVPAASSPLKGLACGEETGGASPTPQPSSPKMSPKRSPRLGRFTSFSRKRTGAAAGGATPVAGSHAPPRPRSLFGGLFNRVSSKNDGLLHAYPELTKAYPSTVGMFASALEEVRPPDANRLAENPSVRNDTPTNSKSQADPGASTAIAKPSPPSSPRTRLATVSRGCVIGAWLLADVPITTLKVGTSPKPSHMQAKIDTAVKKQSSASSRVQRPTAITLSVSRATVTVTSAPVACRTPSPGVDKGEVEEPPLTEPIRFARGSILFCAHGDKHRDCFGIVRQTSAEGGLPQFYCTIFRAATAAGAHRAVLALARACGAAGAASAPATDASSVRRLGSLAARPRQTSASTDAAPCDANGGRTAPLLAADARYCGHVEVLTPWPSLGEQVADCLAAVADRRRAPTRLVLAPCGALRLVDPKAGKVAKEIQLAEALCCCPAAGEDAAKAVLFVSRGDDMAAQVLLAFVFDLGDPALCASACARISSEIVAAVTDACTLACETHPDISQILRSTEGLARGHAYSSLKKLLTKEFPVVATALDPVLGLFHTAESAAAVQACITMRFLVECKMARPPPSRDLLGFFVPPEHEGLFAASCAAAPEATGAGRSEEAWAALLAEEPHVDSTPRLLRMANLAWTGVPHHRRPAVWMEAVGARQRRQSPGGRTYRQYLEEFASVDLSPQAREVALDIPRTFGQRHVRFGSNAKREVSLLPALERVVGAVVAADPERGYWQGMNFLCGFLLVCIPSEEDAFWVALCLIDDVIPCLYGERGPQAELNLFEEVVEDQLPWLAEKLGGLGLTVQGLCTEWLMCLFTTSLPSESLLRLWDLIMLSTAGVRAHRRAVDSEQEGGEAPPDQDHLQESAGGSDGTDDNRGSAAPHLRHDHGGAAMGLPCGTHCVTVLALAILERSKTSILASKTPYQASDAVKHAAQTCYRAEELLSAAAQHAGARADIWHPGHPQTARMSHQRRRVARQVAVELTRMEKVRRLRGIFEQHDAGNKGCLTQGEFLGLFEELFEEAPGEGGQVGQWADQARAVFAVAVRNSGSTTIDYDRFVTVAKRFPHISHLLRLATLTGDTASARLRALFDSFDQSCSGGLSREEIFALVCAIHTASSGHRRLRRVRSWTAVNTALLGRPVPTLPEEEAPDLPTRAARSSTLQPDSDAGTAASGPRLIHRRSISMGSLGRPAHVWQAEADHIFRLCGGEADGEVCFDEFAANAYKTPVLAMGICLLGRDTHGASRRGSVDLSSSLPGLPERAAANGGPPRVGGPLFQFTAESQGFSARICGTVTVKQAWLGKRVGFTVSVQTEFAEPRLVTLFHEDFAGLHAKLRDLAQEATGGLSAGDSTVLQTMVFPPKDIAPSKGATAIAERRRVLQTLMDQVQTMQSPLARQLLFKFLAGTTAHVPAS